MSERLGISGALAKKFLQSEITPLLALVGLLLGLFAVAVTPREEEPQINVTFANVFIPYPGASASEVEHLLTTSAEQVLSEIKGVRHIYSISRPGMAVLTVEFKVGEDRTQAIVRLYNAIYSKQDWLPPNIHVGRPLIKPKGIDDVPIAAGTLWSEDPNVGADQLLRVAHTIETELKRVPGTRDIYTIGGPDRVVHVLLDPQRMSGYGITVRDLAQALSMADTSADAGALVADNTDIPVQAGTFLTTPDEVADLVVGVHDGAPIYLHDVAKVKYGPDAPDKYVWLGTGPKANEAGIKAKGVYPAVTIAVAKKPGANAVTVADQVIKRFSQMQGTFVPEGIHATVTRNYGATADAKAKLLIEKLIFATTAVVLLVLIALGWREAVVVGTAVIITLMITLFASWAWGFTLNRVSLFALIFSIGILVDDAIVVVENVHRHMQLGERKLIETIPVAVDEVGGPTILATFTVIAALLPMAFVSGLMGPYMSPIPINASMGMLISLAVAFILTPWLYNRFFAKVSHGGEHAQPHEDKMYLWLYGVYQKYMGPFLSDEGGRKLRHRLYMVLGVLILASIGLAGVKLVVFKMLPFDNKSEFQVVVDMPEGTTLEQTARVLSALGRYISTVPEVTDYQAYAGTAAPINFNGLVRQYYLRRDANQGDLQVNLIDKSERKRHSHEIALAVRGPLDKIAAKYGADIKVVEVPPGPPVMSPLVAEVYGLDYSGQIKVAKWVKGVFEHTPDIVDIDDSVESTAPKLVLKIDRQRAALLGVSQASVVSAISAALGGDDAAFLHVDQAKYAVPIRLEFPVSDKAHLATLLAMKVRSRNGAMVPLSEVIEPKKTVREHAIYHKDLLPVVYVTGDMAGKLDSPLYGMFEMRFKMRHEAMPNGNTIKQFLTEQPDNPYQYSLKWDGEWQITYETFRDMGIAYSVGLILIYLLVVGQFRSYVVPLIIMAPIPLTIIGIMPGHALLGRQFTATSMIGMIALAGIIVRNSILLVDFIRQEMTAGVSLRDAVLRSGAVRARPIVLTGLAAVLGAFFILDDPIFSGLAVSLIFGIVVSTLLTLVVIPILYYAVMRRQEAGKVGG